MKRENRRGINPPSWVKTDMAITSSRSWLTLIGVSCCNAVTPLSLLAAGQILHYKVDLLSSAHFLGSSMMPRGPLLQSGWTGTVRPWKTWLCRGRLGGSLTPILLIHQTGLNMRDRDLTTGAGYSIVIGTFAKLPPRTLISYRKKFMINYDPANPISNFLVFRDKLSYTWSYVKRGESESDRVQLYALWRVN